MTKSDLKARPVFHRERDAIESHLTIVFAGLVISRHLQNLTGISIKKIVRTLRTARSATIEVDGQRMTLDPELSTPAQEILNRLTNPSGTSQEIAAVTRNWRNSVVVAVSYRIGVPRLRHIRPYHSLANPVH
jgi:hypothetical protein